MSGIIAKKHELMAQIVRQAVFEAFMEIIEQDGLDGVTMQLMAQKAGVSTGSLYNYFDNKEDIVKFVFQRLFDDLYDTANEPIATDDPMERLRILIERIIIFGYKYEAVFALKRRDTCCEADSASEIQYKMINVFRDLISYGIERKVFAQIDSKTAAKLVIALFIGSDHLQDKWSTGDVKTDTDQMLSFILPYLKQGQ